MSTSNPHISRMNYQIIQIETQDKETHDKILS